MRLRVLNRFTGTRRTAVVCLRGTTVTSTPWRTARLRERGRGPGAGSVHDPGSPGTLIE